MNTEQMLAAVISRPGSPHVLELRLVPRPKPASQEILVRVHASALNRADLLQRRGHYPAPPGVPAEIPGLDFAGEVEEIGSAVQLWKRGSRVMGLTGGGAHAEYLVAHERAVAEIPLRLSWEQAAAIPEAFITAHDALWLQAEFVQTSGCLFTLSAAGLESQQCSLPERSARFHLAHLEP